MKKLLILFFIAIGFQSFAQEKLNQFDEKGLRHGLWRGYHETSKRPRYEGTFEHGKETGTFKYFDDTKAGTIIATRDFSKGNNSCYTIFFDQKGNKVSEGNVINKNFDGPWIYYHQESKEIMTTENYVNGNLDGVRKVFYKNGKIAEETNYSNGKKNGVQKIYAESGTLISEHNFADDLYEGTATYYDNKGNKMYEGNYVKNSKSGNWKFFKDGKVTKTVKAINFSKELVKYEEKMAKREKQKTENEAEKK